MVSSGIGQMLVIKGKRYNTISDAAKLLGVSTKTVKSHIAKGIIAAPPTVKYGLRVLKHFPADYMRTAKRKIENYRQGG